MAYDNGTNMKNKVKIKRKPNTAAKELRSSSGPYQMKVEPDKRNKVDRSKINQFDLGY